jgi:hypothetical protein
MTEPQLIVCPANGTTNRVPREKIEQLKRVWGAARLLCPLLQQQI